MCNSTDFIHLTFSTNYTQVVQNLITLVSISVSRTLSNWMIYDKYNLGKIIYIVQYCVLQVCFPLWSLPWLWLLLCASWVCLTSRGTVENKGLCVKTKGCAWLSTTHCCRWRLKTAFNAEKLCGFIWNFWISFFTYFWISTYFMSSRIFFLFFKLFF